MRTTFTSWHARALPGILTCLAMLCFLEPRASAHPVPKESHDRTITICLRKAEAPDKIRVRVEYRLEVDEETVLLRDMLDYRDEVNFVDYFPGRALEYYGHFARLYAPIYAERLLAEANKKRIEPFRCVAQSQRLVDEDGKKLGHLRCDFVFECDFALDPREKTLFFFHDQTYLSAGIFPEPGQLVLTFVNETGLTLESKSEPTELMRKHVSEQPELGDNSLRKISAILVPAGTPAPEKSETPAVPQASTDVPRDSHEDSLSLLRLILHGDNGFWLTLLLAFAFGAAHALTPGHGKTLVAAYLVGERGTVWHAAFLGVVTTVTHTGMVVALALIMTFLPKDMQRTFQAWIQNGLGLVMGLMVVCMGFWLLLQRLAGRADHVHLNGGHHHHGPGAHHHDPVTSARSLSWWGLVALGVTGGLVPCWDAIILLLYTVGTSRFWMVLPAVLAFSAGLAVVLVLIGVFVVQVPRFVQSRWGNGRIVQMLPIASAVFVTLMGLWLCYEGVHSR